MRTSPELDETKTADAVLTARAADGDIAAFETIMRANNQRLFRITRGIVGNDADAEDVVQEAYVRAWQCLRQFDGRSRVSTWLVRIAINEALGRKRRANTRIKTTPLDTVDNVIPVTLPDSPLTPNSGGDPETATQRGEVRRTLERAIDDLPEDFRAVFALRALDERSTAETADLLDIPITTVKTRFHRAKRLLRDAIDEKAHHALYEAYPFAGQRCDRIVARVLARIHTVNPG